MCLVVQTNAEIDRLASMTTTVEGFDGRTSVSFLSLFHTYAYVWDFEFRVFCVLSFESWWCFAGENIVVYRVKQVQN